VAAKVKTAVLRAPGINCNHETALAFELAGATVEQIHVNDLIAEPKQLREFQILAFPGGFSFGDDIASGQVLARKLKYRLAGPLQEFVADGRLILGICNGFQVLVKLGLLPANDRDWVQEAALTYNESGRFEDRWVYLKVEPDSRSVFTKDLPDVIYLPVRHGEGRFLAPEITDHLRDNGQIALRYTDENGSPGAYPINPNGSSDDIAGLSDPTGRIFGLMPHPEVFVRASQHPRWTRGQGESLDGMGIFRNAVLSARELG
jgi:phosphoribosylformylglycinamidine synthase